MPETVKKVDRRVVKTKKAIHNAFAKLLTEKELNDITISDIAELADINRGTFYFHYQDIYALLHAIEDEFFVQFDRTLRESKMAADTLESPYLHAVFSFLGENQNFCRIMLGPHGDMQFVERIKQRVDAQCSYFWRILTPDADPQRFGMYNAFIINGCIGLIQEWLSGESGLTEENVTALTAAIILASVGPGLG